MKRYSFICRDRVTDTSHYITSAEVAFRIANIYGSASYDGSLKYLVFLRDPVRRAISSWEYKVACESGVGCSGEPLFSVI